MRGNWWNNFKQQGNLRKWQFAYGYLTSRKIGKTCLLNNSWPNICSTLTDFSFISVMKIATLLISIELKMYFKLNYLTLCILRFAVSLKWEMSPFPLLSSMSYSNHVVTSEIYFVSFLHALFNYESIKHHLCVLCALSVKGKFTISFCWNHWTRLLSFCLANIRQ